MIGPGHRFRLLAFDFDGTLADSSANIYRAARDAFDALGLPYPGDPAVGATVGLDLMGCARRWLPEGALSDHQRLADAYRHAFVAMRKQGDFHEPLFDGVRETLGSLTHDAVFMGICTGKNRRGLDHMLAYHDIQHHFHTLQTPDTNASKPAPDMVVAALGETGCEAPDCVVIGDTSYDMLMAKAAGALAVGVSYGHHLERDLLQAGADLIIHAMADLPEALARLS